MRYVLLIAALALAVPAMAPPAEANVIKRACMKSDRGAASRALCNCIQQAANATLTRSEQRKASKFFQDPHQAQVIRQSDRSSHEVFWKKYRNFGATAEAYCG